MNLIHLFRDGRSPDFRLYNDSGAIRVVPNNRRYEKFNTVAIAIRNELYIDDKYAKYYDLIKKNAPMFTILFDKRDRLGHVDVDRLREVERYYFNATEDELLISKTIIRKPDEEPREQPQVDDYRYHRIFTHGIDLGRRPFTGGFATILEPTDEDD